MNESTLEELQADLARVEAAMSGAKADIQTTWQQVDAAQAQLRALFPPFPPADQLSAGMNKRYFDVEDRRYMPARAAVHAANVPYTAARDRYQSLRQLQTNLHGNIGQLRAQEADRAARQLGIERLIAGGHAAKPGRLAQLRAAIAGDATAPTDDIAARREAREARSRRAREEHGER